MGTEKTKSWKSYLDTGLMVTIIIAVGGFWANWTYDEANEDAEAINNKNIMFDTPVQKIETTKHIEAIDAGDVKIKWAKDEMVQEKILEKLSEFDKANKKQDCLLIRLNDQYYQLNQKDIHIDN